MQYTNCATISASRYNFHICFPEISRLFRLYEQEGTNHEFNSQLCCIACLRNLSTQFTTTYLLPHSMFRHFIPLVICAQIQIDKYNRYFYNHSSLYLKSTKLILTASLELSYEPYLASFLMCMLSLNNNTYE